MAGLVNGVVGLIKWHYYTAAAINGYTVFRTKQKEWSITANVVNADAYKMAQKPLIFVAEYRKGETKGEWRWPIQTMEIREGRMTATLGAPLP